MMKSMLAHRNRCFSPAWLRYRASKLEKKKILGMKSPVLKHIETVPFGRFTMSDFEGQSLSNSSVIVYKEMSAAKITFVNGYGKILQEN